jgi:long-chain acyl-CoA synthetase
MYGYLRESFCGRDINKMLYFGRTIRSSEFLDTVDSLAAFLVRQGIHPGDAVGIALPNIPEAIFALYAVNAVGAIANFLHPKISEKAFGNLIKKTNTKLIFIYDKLYKTRKAYLKDMPIVICSVSGYMAGFMKAFYRFTEPWIKCGIPFRKAIKQKPVALSFPEPDAPAVYVHSGGTTGEPKTVVLSSRAFNCLSESLVDTIYEKGPKLTDDDIMLMMLPIFHGFGLGVCVHTVLSHGQAALLPKFEPRAANKAIRKYGVTHLAGVPAMFKKMLEDKYFAGEHLKKITKIYCGGDRLDPTTKKDFDNMLKKYGSTAELTEGYGLTESTTVFSVSLNGESAVGCQGRPLKGNRVRVISKEGKDLPPYQTGEFCIASPSLMLGYLDDPEATAQVMRKDEEGVTWLRTGDMGFVDKDGALHFQDRIKRSIKIAAENIFPSEIERIVCALPEVEESCVIRSTCKGKPCTKLIVVLKNKAQLDSALIKRIKKTITDNLVKYALPREIIAVDSLARTPMGKIDYRLYENSMTVSADKVR